MAHSYLEIKNIILSYLKSVEPIYKQSLCITNLQEHPFIWEFAFNTKAYHIDKNKDEMLLGNKPICIDKENGNFYQIYIGLHDILFEGKKLSDIFIEKKENNTLPKPIYTIPSSGSFSSE